MTASVLLYCICALCTCGWDLGAVIGENEKRLGLGRAVLDVKVYGRAAARSVPSVFWGSRPPAVHTTTEATFLTFLLGQDHQLFRSIMRVCHSLFGNDKHAPRPECRKM